MRKLVKPIKPSIPSSRCVLYARVSSADQERGYSIPAQRELLKEYAAENGMVIEREFVEAETAKRAGRVQFEAMLGYLRANPECCHILVEKTDRLLRNFEDAAAIERLRCHIHFVKEGKIMSEDCGASDKFMQGMRMLMAKIYVDNLSEEVKKGMRTKAAQGLWPSYAPLGYENTAGADQKRIITPHPVLGPMVTQLFVWFASGNYSLKEVAQKTFEEGFRFRRSQGKVPVSTVHKILRNPIYMGEFQFGGERYGGRHEALVLPAVWNRVQEILDRRGSRKHRRTTRAFAFSGLVKCGHCGCSLVAEVKKKKYTYYHCSGYRGKCGQPYTPEDVLRREFAEALRKLSLPPAMLRWLEAELIDIDQTKVAASAQAGDRYASELSRCEARLSRLYDDRLDGRIDIDTYDRKAQEIRDQQGQLRQKIEEFKTAAVRPGRTGVDLALLIRQTATTFLNQAAGEQQKLLRLVLQEASWQGGALQTCFREPFATVSHLRVGGEIGFPK